MAKIVECIPNISEGRNMEVVEAVLNEVRSTAGVTLLDHSSDPNHNRTVITFLGSPEGVAEAAVKLAKKAVELIDLTKHVGEHPRMGAVDVCPFVPVKEVSTEECVELSKQVAKRIWEEAGMPVFLPSAVILEPPKIKSDTVSIVSPSISHEVVGPDAMIFVF